MRTWSKRWKRSPFPIHGEAGAESAGWTKTKAADKESAERKQKEVMSATSKKEALMAFMVREEAGWSLPKSELKFRESARSFIARQEADEQLIKECTKVVFARFPSAFLNISYICSNVIGLMGERVPALKDPHLHPQLSKRITEVMKAEEAVGNYVVRKGPGGGYQVTVPIVTTPDVS